MDDLTNKEQIELLKKWWHDYGKSILIAIIIGLGGGYGWRYYKQYEATQQVQASALYQQVLQADYSNNNKDSVAKSKQIVKQYPSTAYATAARFILAKEAVVQHNYPLALTHLDWIIQHNKSTSLRAIARLRAARVLVQQNKLVAAKAMLQKIKDKAFVTTAQLAQDQIKV